MTCPLTLGEGQTTIMRENNRALPWESVFHPLKALTNINQLIGGWSQPWKKKGKENWRYLKAFPTKGFSVWVWIRTWTFLTLAVRDSTHVNIWKVSCSSNTFPTTANVSLLSFFCKSSKVLNTHPLPPIINNPKQSKYREFFVGILKFQTILGTGHVGVVMGKRQARKKDIRVKFFLRLVFPYFNQVFSNKEKVFVLFK